MKSISLISIHAKAPAKPEWGAPCNGCGVCCLSEPCPVGIVISGRRRGACEALRWDEMLQSYRCGVLVAQKEVLQQALPRWLNWTLPLWSALLDWRAVRWIAAGVGCDCSFKIQAEPEADSKNSPRAEGQ